MQITDLLYKLLYGSLVNRKPFYLVPKTTVIYNTFLLFLLFTVH